MDLPSSPSDPICAPITPSPKRKQKYNKRIMYARIKPNSPSTYIYSPTKTETTINPIPTYYSISFFAAVVVDHHGSRPKTQTLFHPVLDYIIFFGTRDDD